MKFENRGKWLKEAEDKLAAYDTQEHPDYLDGDDKVLTMEDDDDEELMNFEEDELDIVDEEDDTLDSPEEEEDAIAMSESSQVNEAECDDKILKDLLNNIKETEGWHELEDFADAIEISSYTLKKPYKCSLADLEKMINASGIAKVKQVKDIKMSTDMKNFMKSNFNPTDKIIVTRKPMSSRFYGESSQVNEADLSAYKQILNGAKLILQQKGFKEDKSLAGKDGIFFRKGDKAVTINYFETTDDVQVMGYDIKEQEDTYINDFRLNKISKLNIEDSVKSAIKSLNESSQKNEMNYKTASEYTRAARQAIDIINKFIEDEKESAKLQGYGNVEMRQMNTKISKLKEAIKELEFYKLESSQKNEVLDEDYIDRWVEMHVDARVRTLDELVDQIAKYPHPKVKQNKAIIKDYVMNNFWKDWEKGKQPRDGSAFTNAIIKAIGTKFESSQKNERNYDFTKDQFIKASTILKTVASNSDTLKASDAAILLKAAAILTDNLNKFIAGEAEGTMKDLTSLIDIGFIPISMKELVDKYHIKPDANLLEIKQAYQRAYKDYMDDINRKISKATGKPFPNSTWSLGIKLGEIYRGAPKNQGGTAVHNIFGVTKWYYELYRDGRPYTQCSTIDEVIQKIKNY